MQQAIHPAQVETIQAAYSPSTKREWSCAFTPEVLTTVDILRAARILHAKAIHETNGKGAFELDGKMIDAPVMKQVGLSW